MARDVRGILLCGGASARFGANKLLETIPGAEGEGPIAARAARNLVAGTGRVLALIPLGAAQLRGVLEPTGCEIVESDRTARGMGASLAAAVAASDRAEGWIVALGDMPLILPSTIRAVAQALAEGALIAAPVASGSLMRGHPVGFAAALRAELVALDGDTGARSVVERHRDRVRHIPVDDPGIYVDLDTREQLAALARR
jgi:molybdenum cofactor cytidylyltransferase